MARQYNRAVHEHDHTHTLLGVTHSHPHSHNSHPPFPGGYPLGSLEHHTTRHAHPYAHAGMVSPTVNDAVHHDGEPTHEQVDVHAETVIVKGKAGTVTASVSTLDDVIESNLMGVEVLEKVAQTLDRLLATNTLMLAHLDGAYVDKPESGPEPAPEPEPAKPVKPKSKVYCAWCGPSIGDFNDEEMDAHFLNYHRMGPLDERAPETRMPPPKQNEKRPQPQVRRVSR